MSLKVSIITVCYNSESTIRDTIESIVTQSYENIEYIIIDGQSSDKTLSIVKEYSEHIASIVSEPDNGIYDAMNKGLKLAAGDVIAFLNSDDFYESSKVISDVVKCFSANTDTSIVMGDLVFVESSNLHKIVRFYSSLHFKPWKLRFGWMPPHTATFVLRSVYEKVGGFSLEYKIASDYELFVRMLMVHKFSFVQINKVLVRMRAGGLSTSGIKNSLLLNSEIVKACKSHGVYTNLLFVLSKTPFKLFELFKSPKKSN